MERGLALEQSVAAPVRPGAAHICRRLTTQARVSGPARALPETDGASRPGTNQDRTLPILAATELRNGSTTAIPSTGMVVRCTCWGSIAPIHYSSSAQQFVVQPGEGPVSIATDPGNTRPNVH